MTISHLRLGTRKSALALAQSGLVARAVEAANPGVSVELVPIVTRGDTLQGSLAELGGKGLFTIELEEGLKDGSLDFAVHSLKDLPVELPEELTVAAYPERADPRDALISEVASDLDGLPEGGVVLTGSLRRTAQILARRPDLEVVAIRGNVDTRIEKWRQRKAAGVILARAGLERLGIDDVPIHALDPEQMIPAPGQGTLALEVRAGGDAEAICHRIDHAPSGDSAIAEREVVAAFGGDCTLPLAAWAREEEHDGVRKHRMTALLATPDGRHVARADEVGTDPRAVAATCVRALRAEGAEEILKRLRGDEA